MITKICSNRSQVQGSTFRVKDKEGIEDPKSSLQGSALERILRRSASACAENVGRPDMCYHAEH